jgi:hypothetical protein
MADDPFRAPTDAKIDAAETRLNFKFHPDYRAFLKRCGNVGESVLEPAVILPGSGHLDLFEIAEEAWERQELPRNLLPFIEDNGDYYCLTETGGVRFWSHNGATNEKWATFDDWYQQVCVEEAGE